MDDALKIGALIAILSFIMLVFFLISVLLDLKKTLRKLDPLIDTFHQSINQLKDKFLITLSDISHLKSRLMITLDEVSHVKSTLNTSLQSFDGLTDQISHSVEVFEKRTDKFIAVMEPLESLVNLLYHKIMPTVAYGTNIVSAATKAYKTISSMIQHKKT
jgi:uncharacterized protein YoxC